MDRPDSLINRGLKLSHLRLLEALSDSGQISDAARRVGIAQPAASRLIAEMERIVGRPIHERTGRGIELTSVGQALAMRARRIHMELRDAARDVSEIDMGLVGHVRIGSVTGPALDRVLPAIRTARVVQPKVTYEVIVGTSDVLCENVLSGRIDFAIGRLPTGPERHLFKAQMIASEPVSLMVRKGHPLERMVPIEPAELMNYDWVLPGQEALLYQTVMTRLRALGLPEPMQRFSTASFLLTLALIQQSNAIAPLAHAVCASFTHGRDAPYRIVPVDLGIEVEPYGFITRANTILTPAASRMAQMMMSEQMPV